MSYPGGYPPYPPHQQGHGQPQPYQTTTPLSYPVYPASAAPSGPISGYPSASPYPSNPSPYPPSYPPSQPAPYSGAGAPGYPPSQPAYPPSQSAYPPMSAPYPGAPQGPYPGAQQGSYPGAQQGPYPGAQPGPYPGSQPSSYPPSQPAPYPGSQPSPYPSSHGSHPPPQGGHHHSPYPPSNLGSAPGHGQGHAQPQQKYSKGTPTVRPAHPFDPRNDAEVLRKAMKGFGTDEKAIIQVLCRRTNAQRQEIALQFKTMYGKDLIKDLKSELSGNFEDLIVALMTPIAEFQAKELHHAISGLGTNENTLVELLCSATNQEIHAMRAAYEKLFHESLESALQGDTSGSFRRLMVSLCQGRRSENYMVDPQSAGQDAQALLNAGELVLGTDESTFNMILCTRSYPQLTQIFIDYQHMAGHDIEKAIRSEFSGDIESGLLAIIKVVKNKAEFFAAQLHSSMAGLGTRDRALIRIMATRCEIDLEDIKRAFSHKYGKSLADFIKDDTSGDYKRCLLALLE